MSMRILVVAMVNSIHTVRWLQQFDDDKDKKIILFPSTFGGIKNDLKSWGRLYSLFSCFNPFKRSVIVHLPVRKINSAYQLFMHHFFGAKWRAKWLARTIRNLKPDIVHSLEFQNAGYLCLHAKKIMGDDFPTWIATNWGSDIYLFSQLKGHHDKIKSILHEADFYSAECSRDYDLAHNLGMIAKELPVIPNSGGMHLEKISSMRQNARPSQRKMLLIKGYQTIFGRALTALKALELIADKLQDFKVCIFLATPEVEIAAELIANKTGLEIDIIPMKGYLDHDEMLRLHAMARAYVGLSISDGISTSMLEAMALGAFPIQTCTSCANEWVEDGVTGLIAPCDDEKAIADMILRAMTDDALVDNAADKNWDTICKKAAYDHVQAVAKNSYQSVYDYSRQRQA